MAFNGAPNHINGTLTVNGAPMFPLCNIPSFGGAWGGQCPAWDLVQHKD